MEEHLDAAVLVGPYFLARRADDPSCLGSVNSRPRGLKQGAMNGRGWDCLETIAIALAAGSSCSMLVIANDCPTSVESGCRLTVNLPPAVNERYVAVAQDHIVSGFFCLDALRVRSPPS